MDCCLACFACVQFPIQAFEAQQAYIDEQLHHTPDSQKERKAYLQSLSDANKTRHRGLITHEWLIIRVTGNVSRHTRNTEPTKESEQYICLNLTALREHRDFANDENPEFDFEYYADGMPANVEQPPIEIEPTDEHEDDTAETAESPASIQQGKRQATQYLQYFGNRERINALHVNIDIIPEVLRYVFTLGSCRQGLRTVCVCAHRVTALKALRDLLLCNDFGRPHPIAELVGAKHTNIENRHEFIPMVPGIDWSAIDLWKNRPPPQPKKTPVVVNRGTVTQIKQNMQIMLQFGVQREYMHCRWLYENAELLTNRDRTNIQHFMDGTYVSQTLRAQIFTLNARLRCSLHFTPRRRILLETFDENGRQTASHRVFPQRSNKTLTGISTVAKQLYKQQKQIATEERAIKVRQIPTSYTDVQADANQPVLASQYSRPVRPPPNVRTDIIDLISDDDDDDGKDDHKATNEPSSHASNHHNHNHHIPLLPANADCHETIPASNVHVNETIHAAHAQLYDNLHSLATIILRKHMFPNERSTLVCSFEPRCAHHATMPCFNKKPRIIPLETTLTSLHWPVVSHSVPPPHQEHHVLRIASVGYFDRQGLIDLTQIKQSCSRVYKYHEPFVQWMRRMIRTHNDIRRQKQFVLITNGVWTAHNDAFFGRMSNAWLDTLRPDSNATPDWQSKQATVCDLETMGAECWNNGFMISAFTEKLNNDQNTLTKLVLDTGLSGALRANSGFVHGVYVQAAISDRCANNIRDSVWNTTISKLLNEMLERVGAQPAQPGIARNGNGPHGIQINEVLVPMNTGSNHWTALQFICSNKRINVINSMPQSISSSHRIAMQVVVKLLHYASTHQQFAQYFDLPSDANWTNVNSWTVHRIHNERIVQPDGYNCGPIVCTWLEARVHDCEDRIDFHRDLELLSLARFHVVSRFFADIDGG